MDIFSSFFFFFSLFVKKKKKKDIGWKVVLECERGLYSCKLHVVERMNVRPPRAERKGKVQFGQRFCPLAGSSSNTTTTTTKTTTMADSSSIKRKAEAPTGGEGEENSNNKRAKKVRLDNTNPPSQFPSLTTCLPRPKNNGEHPKPDPIAKNPIRQVLTRIRIRISIRILQCKRVIRGFSSRVIEVKKGNVRVK